VLFFASDLHFDHDPPQDCPLMGNSPEAERSLLDCLNHVRERLTGVVLLGDVFDSWVEYRDLVPKGLTRLLGQLALWSDAGLPVHVCAGNHDPWHRDWFEQGLGFTLHRSAARLNADGCRVHAAHGDLDMRSGAGPWTRIVRSRAALRLYTGILPGDSGQRLARWTSRRLRRPDYDADASTALRDAAVRILADGDVDAVLFGHGHTPWFERTGVGTYANPGAWPLHRTFGLIDASGPTLYRWNGTSMEELAATEAGTSR
jgi:UDP-2,3-diacylglucosamine hydrolase